MMSSVEAVSADPGAPTEASLAEFWGVVLSLRAESSRTAKLQIVEDNLTETARYCWEAALHPLRVFHITESLLAKYGAFENRSDAGSEPLDDLRPFINAAEHRDRGHVAMADFWRKSYGHWSPQAKEAAMAVLDKDLNAGIAPKSYNKIMKECGLPLLPDFPVALGEVYKGQPVWEGPDQWYASRKLDGVRCLMHCYLAEGLKPVALSRDGRVLRNITVVRKALKSAAVAFGHDVVLDGELAIQDADGNDNFKAVAGSLNRKSGEIPNVVFHIFDAIPLVDFERGQCETLFSLRQQGIKASGICEDGGPVRYVRQKLITDATVVQSGLEHAAAKGWEGLILRKNAPYLGKRSKDIYKCKDYHETELRVISIESGEKSFPGAIGKDGVRGPTVIRECMASAIVDYSRGGKASRVGVGSGWSNQQRLYYHAYPKELLGAVLTVAYTEECEDEDGKPSLRFPRVKRIHPATDRED